MRPIINALSPTAASTDSMQGVSDMVIENMNCLDDIARASRNVIAKRVALGIEAVLVPHCADHDEFARIIPEKVDAFSAAGKVMMQKSGEANRQIIGHLSLEMMTATNDALSMRRCSSPAELAVAQSRLAYAWMGRATLHSVAMGILAMNAQAAALAPIRQAVVNNAERLAV